MAALAALSNTLSHFSPPRHPLQMTFVCLCDNWAQYYPHSNHMYVFGNFPYCRTGNCSERFRFPPPHFNGVAPMASNPLIFSVCPGDISYRATVNNKYRKSQAINSLCDLKNEQYLSIVCGGSGGPPFSELRFIHSNSHHLIIEIAWNHPEQLRNNIQVICNWHSEPGRGGGKCWYRLLVALTVSSANWIHRRGSQLMSTLGFLKLGSTPILSTEPSIRISIPSQSPNKMIINWQSAIVDVSFLSFKRIFFSFSLSLSHNWILFGEKRRKWWKNPTVDR